jgi:hypothetical protein
MKSYSAVASKRWREANPEKAKASATPYKGAAYYQAWRTKNREKRLVIERQWRLKNPAHGMFSNAKERAKLKKVSFNLEKGDIVIPERCPCCQHFLEVGRTKVHSHSPTLDRLDLSRGYIRGNVWVICHFCNRQKSDMSVAQLRALADKIEAEIERQGCEF